MKHPAIRFFFIIFVGITFGQCLAEENKKSSAKPVIPVGKDTTYFVDCPLNADGMPDYQGYLNFHYGKNVTKENNAMVVLLPIVRWSKSATDDEKKELYAKLGIQGKGVKTIPVITLDDYVSQNAPKEKLTTQPSYDDPEFTKKISEDLVDSFGGTKEQAEKFADKLMNQTTTEAHDEALEQYCEIATMQPWTAQECPMIAGWVKANKPVIEIGRQASRKSHFFSPYVTSQKSGQANLICSLPLNFRQMVKCCAWRKVGEGDIDGAIDDVLILLRLGKLYSQQKDVHYLVGQGLVRYAYSIISHLATTNKLSSVQARTLFAAVQKYSVESDLHEFIDINFRLPSLYYATNFFGAISEGLPKVPLPQNFTPQEVEDILIDKAEILRLINKKYNRIDAAVKKSSYSDQVKALKALGHDPDNWSIKGLKAQEEQYTANIDQCVNQLRKDMTPDELQQLREKFSTNTAGLFCLGQESVSPSFLKSEMSFKNDKLMTQIVLALAIYKTEHKKYPETLRALSPKFFSTLPVDSFSNKPFIYKRRDKGYVLYSVGPNLCDEKCDEDRDDFDDVILKAAE